MIKNIIADNPSKFDYMTITEKLVFYGLHMQIEHGDINTPRPSIFRATDRLMWEAWNSVTFRGYTKE